MASKGVSEQTIINALRATRAAYYLTTAHVLDLQQGGAPQSVIDYLLSTPQIFPPVSQRYYYYYSPPAIWWHDWHHHHHHHH